MILVRASQICAVAMLALGAAQAQADVMEIDSTGARWVAGGIPAHGPQLGAISGPAQAELSAIVIPDTAPNHPLDANYLVPQRYAAKIAELSERYNLSPALLEALVWQESRWRENAVSPVGARGLAQLMPGTARYLGVNPDDPFASLEGGARYLREQLDRFDGNLEKALAAYNAGPERVARADGIPNIRETQLYVAAIMNRLASRSRPVGQ